MADVTFRFYAQLNDFLPEALRGRRFRRDVPSSSSIKDAIEALGVPHPEVDVILVQNEARDFRYRPGNGADVSVYPVFRSIDVTGVRRVGGDPPRPVRFVLDVHLGKLATLLRLGGFDALVLKDDAEAASASARESRVTLTRDVGLLKRSVIQYGYWIRQTNPELQFVEVLERYDLIEQLQPFVRCLRCNTLLVAADAASVADRILPRTRAEHRAFRRCPGCDRVYWPGSHYDHLVRLLDRARQRLWFGRDEDSVEHHN